MVARRDPSGPVSLRRTRRSIRLALQVVFPRIWPEPQGGRARSSSATRNPSASRGVEVLIVTQPTERALAEEASLVERSRDGDDRAFGQLVMRYQALAARVVRFVAPGIDVEDVVQEAFVKAWYALPRFRTGAAFRPWICRIAANEARNRVRSAQRRNALVLREAAVS